MTAPGCLSPASCPVPSPATVDLRRRRTAKWSAGTRVFTAFRHAHWPNVFNDSGLGSARFSPVAHPTGGPAATMYLARTATVALLETVFHDLHDAYPRLISEAQLGTRGVVSLATPQPLVLLDLRDDALAVLGITREQLVATTPAHYACTRQWAERLLFRSVGGTRPAGLLWGSRVAELAGADHPLLRDVLPGPNSEVAMVVSDPGGSASPLPTDVAAWGPSPPINDLLRGPGRQLVDAVATLLGATVVGP